MYNKTFISLTNSNIWAYYYLFLFPIFYYFSDRTIYTQEKEFDMVSLLQTKKDIHFCCVLLSFLIAYDLVWWFDNINYSLFFGVVLNILTDSQFEYRNKWMESNQRGKLVNARSIEIIANLVNRANILSIMYWF